MSKGMQSNTKCCLCKVPFGLCDPTCDSLAFSHSGCLPWENGKHVSSWLFGACQSSCGVCSVYYTCMCETEGWGSSLVTCHLICWDMVSHCMWSTQIHQSWLTNTFQESSCLHPSAWLFVWMLEIQIRVVILFRRHFTNQPFLQHLHLFFNPRNKSINDVTFWLIICVLVLGVRVWGLHCYLSFTLKCIQKISCRWID